MADLIRASILGELPGGEKWSVNPVFEITTGSVVTALELTAAVNAGNAVVPNTQFLTMMNNATKVTGLRLEARKVTGELEAIAEGVRTTPAVGSGGSPHPYQTSLVTSLRGLSSLAAAKGRLYWPATGVSITDPTLRPSTANVASHLGGIKTYLQALQAAIDGAVDETLWLAVWSRKNAALSRVTKLMMGDVLDVQRRRRDTLRETYSEVIYP